MANFGISEKIEKIETFISENLKIFGYDLNILIWTTPPQIFWYTRHPKKVVGLRLQKKDYQLLIQSVWLVKN